MVFASLGGVLVGPLSLRSAVIKGRAPGVWTLPRGSRLLSLMWGDDIVHAYLGWAG